MATYVFYAYSAEVLAYDREVGGFSLDKGFDAEKHLLKITIEDDDKYLDGDLSGRGGDDWNQIGMIETMSGDVLAKGQISFPAFASLKGPEGEVFLDRIEIGGKHFGYFSSDPLEPGGCYPVCYSEKTGEHKDGYDNRTTYDQVGEIACFGPGTLIETDCGPRAVDALRCGDLVRTLDAGLQPIVWIEQSRISAAQVRAQARLRAVRIRAGALGRGQPICDLLVSRDHRMLLRGGAVDLMFGGSVLAAAGHLRGCPGIGLAPLGQGMVYTHILLPAHHIVRANGAWCESFFPGEQAIRRLSPRAVQGLRRVLGGRMVRMQTARRCLSAREARMIARCEMRKKRVAGAVVSG